jgi:hypothetical protein
MSILRAYKRHDDALVIQPLSAQRDWMEETPARHAYHCYPVTTANTIGWTLSAPYDVSFIWDGINDTGSDHIQILDGADKTYTGRGQSSVSFNTGLILRSDKNISVLTITPQNYFYEDFEVISSLISTSFLEAEFPLAIKARTPNKVITIKAGQPIATIIPISLTSLKEESVEILDFIENDEYNNRLRSYGEAAQVINKAGKWTDWYRDAVNEKGEKVGEHEVKALKLQVVNNSKWKNHVE